MPKKPDSIDTKKVGALNKSKEIASTDKVEKVSSVGQTSATSSVGSVTRSGDSVTHRFSIEDKEQLFQLVEEEAVKLFGKSKLSPEKKELIAQAVKAAIESGLISKEEDSDKQPKND